MPVTLQQIADRLGVSLMTVSQAINDKGHLSPRTRRRVLKTAQAMRYRPNAAARAMTSGRFNSVTLLLGLEGNRSYLPADLLYAAHDALSQRDMHLNISRLSDEVLTSDQSMPKILRMTLSDGLLINYRSGVPQRLRELVEMHRIPSVWIDSHRRHDCVYHDNLDAARRATEYLLALGHRRIAYVDHYPERDLPESIYHRSVADRREGYARAMKQAGLPVRMIHRPEGIEFTQSRVDLARQWLEVPNTRDRPTAVLAYVQATAFPVLIAATSLGIQVPRDLSIMTFHGRSEGIGYRMGSMVVPDRELGIAAVEMLLAKVADPSCNLPSRVFTSTVDPGLSCGPAPTA